MIEKINKNLSPRREVFFLGDLMDRNRITGYVAAGLGCAAVTFGICWYTMDYSRRDIIELGKKMSVVNECEKVMKEADYPFSDNSPIESAINGYVSGLASDKFTYYTESSDDAVKEMTAYVNTSGTAEASGFQVDIAEDGNILIKDVTEGLAADKQGLKKGDVITAVDGVSVSEAKYENIANKLLGKKDTKVNITIRRGDEEQDIEFVRDHVYKNLIENEKKQGIGILRIKSIDQFIGGQFDQSVKALEDCNKIVIDLRNNPGGDGDVSMDWAARLCGQAQVTKYYYTGKKEELSLEGKKDFEDKKIVILVNENTASAAEIFCANVAQNLDVKIVGTKTFGKGVFQNYADLSNGGQLCYVAGSFTVGDWECWQGVGISPDVEVQMDPALIGTDDDIQLKKAMELLD